MSVDFDALTRELQEAVLSAESPENLVDYQRFFREKLADPVRLRTPILRRISASFFRGFRSRDREELLAYCDFLLKTDSKYRVFVAFDWAEKLRDRLILADFDRLERWLADSVDNWGSCDHLCGPVGTLLANYPELSPRRMKWTDSKSWWVRRAAAVSLIRPLRRRLLLEDALETAARLLQDPEDLVLKGYGWMLKVAGSVSFEEVSEYVLRERNRMPRTALRYAVEKWPRPFRKQALRPSP